MKHILIALLIIFVGCAEDGKNGANGIDGVNGVDGQQGSQGVAGNDGLDGIDGQDGAPGLDSIIEVLDPCGKQSDYDEVFFRFSDGLVYAVYANIGSNKVHLVKLVAGNWVTTDRTNCYFTFTEENTIINEHN